MLATMPATTAHDRMALMARLYQEQIAKTPVEYLVEHGEDGTAGHHVNVFEWYLPHLRDRQVVLDWGCNHGPDSCLLRHEFGDSIDLHACDFAAEDDYTVFRDYARPHYKRLTDPLRLPYENDTFEAVIGSGVLEHTAMDGEALKELFRILQPGGLLLVTYLPYAYSLDEWRRRNVRKVDYHRRLYTRRGFARLLLSHGFEPQTIELQGFVPNRLRRSGRPLWWKVLRPALHPIVDALWKPVLRPLRYPLWSQGVICGVARKMTIM